MLAIPYKTDDSPPQSFFPWHPWPKHKNNKNYVDWYLIAKDVQIGSTAKWHTGEKQHTGRFVTERGNVDLSQSPLPIWLRHHQSAAALQGTTAAYHSLIKYHHKCLQMSCTFSFLRFVPVMRGLFFTVLQQFWPNALCDTNNNSYRW